MAGRTSREWLPQQAAFEFVRRGYSPEQVNEHLDRLEYDLRIITADRDSANHRLSELYAQLQATQSEGEEFRRQLDRSAMAPTSMSGMSERMQRMIRLAEDEAADIRARARAEAGTSACRWSVSWPSSPRRARRSVARSSRRGPTWSDR